MKPREKVPRTEIGAGAIHEMPGGLMAGPILGPNDLTLTCVGILPTIKADNADDLVNVVHNTLNHNRCVSILLKFSSFLAFSAFFSIL